MCVTPPQPPGGGRIGDFPEIESMLGMCHFFRNWNSYGRIKESSHREPVFAGAHGDQPKTLLHHLRFIGWYHEAKGLHFFFPGVCHVIRNVMIGGRSVLRWSFFT